MIGTHFRGRLGNNMFQYSYIRSVAERKGYDFSIYGDKTQFKNIFPHLELKCENFNYKNRNLEEVNYDLKQMFYNLEDDILTFGFFINHKYFEDSPVNDWFKIFLNDEENKLYNELIVKYNPNEYCYIHFRGTDFMDIELYKTNKDFFNISQKLVNKTKFVVITDDIENAKKYINADDYITNNYKIDLKLLTSSKNLIIPSYTTFSWWGAWLSSADMILTPDINDFNYIKNDRFIYLKK